MLLSIFMSTIFLCQAQSTRLWEANYLSEFEDSEKVESIVLAGYFTDKIMIIDFFVCIFCLYIIYFVMIKLLK